MCLGGLIPRNVDGSGKANRCNRLHRPPQALAFSGLALRVQFRGERMYTRENKALTFSGLRFREYGLGFSFGKPGGLGSMVQGLVSVAVEYRVFKMPQSFDFPTPFCRWERLRRVSKAIACPAGPPEGCRSGRIFFRYRYLRDFRIFGKDRGTHLAFCLSIYLSRLYRVCQ